MNAAMIFLLLGGLGMFLYGMKMMSDGLERLAGDRMRRVLEVLTNNRFAGVGVGLAVTSIIQSSSATTVMLVGFVNAGLMTLLQATGVIMGANIGTTITAQLIAFKLSDVAPAILFIGMVMSVFVKKRAIERIGNIILGFGVLFVGLSLMAQAMEPLQYSEAFRSFLVSFKSPVVGVLVGTAFTAVIQSSSASIGILQTLAMIGLIELDSAVYVVLGQNIGTCITAILAAIGKSTNSKRTAGIHLMFNITGTAVYLVLLALFPGVVGIIESWSPGDVSRQIANFHTFFNVSMTLLLIGFAKQMVWLIKKIVPDRHDPDKVERKLMYLSGRTAKAPLLVLGDTLKELTRMGSISAGNFQNALESFFDRDEQKANKVIEVEKTVDYLSRSITSYLISYRSLDIPEHDIKVLGSLHHVIIDMERISDFAENVAEYSLSMAEIRGKLTPDAHAELVEMSAKTMETLKKALEVFESRDKSRLGEVEALEREVDEMREKYMDNHIERLQNELCDPQTGVVFTNMVTTLERVADHAVNIAFSIRSRQKDS
ncbi:MAG: Na/Pi cotransporter family protein [Burkholderiales bacterium]